MLWSNLFLLSLSLLACGVVAASEPPPARKPEPGPGVPRELARHRAAHYRDVRYALEFFFAPRSNLLSGSVKVGVTLDADAGDLVLDWRVTERGVEPAERVSVIKVNG